MYRHYRHITVPAGILVALGMTLPVMILEQMGGSLTEAILLVVCLITPFAVFMSVIVARFVSTRWQEGDTRAATVVRLARQFWSWFAGGDERRPAYDWLILLIILWQATLYMLRWFV